MGDGRFQHDNIIPLVLFKVIERVKIKRADIRVGGISAQYLIDDRHNLGTGDLIFGAEGSVLIALDKT